MQDMERRWWHDATVYQIYPRSFNDSNGDGIGDIPGIIAKLDYLSALGISVIWLSPVFKSPMDDNGYDIADYRDIAPEFGTLDDFDRLISEADRRGIRIVTDLVVNHTSDEHDWFRASRESRDNRYRDFYIWRDPGADGGAPSDMQSVFGGSAWAFDDATGQYYYHHFSKRQPDLNWENADLRAEIHDMMNWWLDRGIGGFRMDVIDLIGKRIDQGIVADGPMLHSYLKDMHDATFGNRDVLTVGEAWSATPGSALLFSGRARGELSMVFQFEHIVEQWDSADGKWRPKPFDLVKLKAVLNKWQYALSADGWNSLFWGNHDLPRALSRYGNTGKHRVRSAKMLATVLNLMRGTPYIYQGDEIGMSNVPFRDISQYRDLETLNMYKLRAEAGETLEDFITAANQSSRDNARTPMQWRNAKHAGFTTGTPWIEANPNYDQVNAESALADPESIFHHYRQLAQLRKEHPVIVYGHYQSYFDHHPAAFVYTRALDGATLLVAANFSDAPVTLDLPPELQMYGQNIIHNIEPISQTDARLDLRPYEAFAILRR